MKVSTADIEKLIDQARQKGLKVSERGCNLSPLNPPAAVEDDTPTLLPSCHVPPNVWIVGVLTRSESNERKWQDKSNRTKAARAAVSKCFGKSLPSLAQFAEHYHAGGSLRIVFTRLAPKRLDRGNVSTALKAVEDALALMLGADDGDARWLATYAQETSERYGVRIELHKGVG